jgi:hypothetical protein
VLGVDARVGLDTGFSGDDDADSATFMRIGDLCVVREGERCRAD